MHISVSELRALVFDYTQTVMHDDGSEADQFASSEIRRRGAHPTRLVMTVRLQSDSESGDPHLLACDMPMLTCENEPVTVLDRGQPVDPDALAAMLWEKIEHSEQMVDYAYGRLPQSLRDEYLTPAGV